MVTKVARREDVESEAAKPMLWFRHDVDAHDDLKCKRLLRRLGMAGYGRWWRLLEIIYAESGHAISVEDAEDAEMLADDLCMESTDELADFLGTLADIGLIEMPGDGTVRGNQRAQDEQVRFGINRVNGKLGGRPRKTAVKTDH